MTRFDAVTAWLAGLPVWKFVVLLFLSEKLLMFCVLVFIPESWSGDEGPDVAFSILGFISVSVGVALFETLVFQFLIIWLINRWVTRKIPVQVAVSAVLFGVQHTYNLAYVIAMFVVGIVLAWGFCAYYYRYGLGKAFWSVALVHGLSNALAFGALYFNM